MSAPIPATSLFWLTTQEDGTWIPKPNYGLMAFLEVLSEAGPEFAQHDKDLLEQQMIDMANQFGVTVQDAIVHITTDPDPDASAHVDAATFARGKLVRRPYSRAYDWYPPDTDLDPQDVAPPPDDNDQPAPPQVFSPSDADLEYVWRGSAT